MRDENGNVDCVNCVNCRNSTGCNNSTRCDNSTGCDNSTWCDNSTRCDNSTGCNNCAYCLYSYGLTLEKFMVFNKQVKNKKAFEKIRQRVVKHFGTFKHPKDLTKKDIEWLKKNVKQFNQKVLNEVIENSIKPDNPKQ